MINRLSCRAIKTGNYLLLPEAMTVSSSYASRMKAKNIIQKRHTISTKNNIEYIKRK
ncbi:unnamed protein product [Penicillium salamii]|uniref:Uncharacterized protein n=1 Tax=Penicillium salamii TaxID=1612424 RepID=A0A9W4K237_9EURO|nr:unnamed protein product [Penicillium salamii]CAG7950540.1 unnamed protein product [Penicillium salamii]CAG8194899.1 unnamed protein product [Penicillium salamii]CAG8213835.1 unnamed protein product [Penicillium salamii]CAG8257643.1 unnamed protein product [Penicillium salamii]